MKKRIISLLLCALLLMSILPVQAFAVGDNAAAIGGTEYETLAAAFTAAAADGGTITLLRDIEWSEDPLTIEGKSVTLDFDGHKITGGGVTWIDTIASGAGLTLVDTWLDFESTTPNDWPHFIEENKGTLTFASTYGDGVVLRGGSTDSGLAAWEMVYENTGTVIINAGDYYVYGEVVEYNGIEDENENVIPGSIEINGGKIECNSSVVYANYGDVTIEDCNVTSDDTIIDESYVGSIRAENSTFKADGYAFDDIYGGTLELTDCTVEAGSNGVYISVDDPDSAEITLTDCTFNTESECVYVSNGDNTTITINGGTFTSVGDDCVDVCEDAALTINGGTFKTEADDYDAVYMGSGATVTINDGTFTATGDGGNALYLSVGAAAVLGGGVFEGSPAIGAENNDFSGITFKGIYIPNPAGWKTADRVEIILGEAVAKIGDTEYAMLSAAFAAAGDGETITLLSDIEWSEDYAPLNIAGKSVTLDFDGHKISGGGVTWIDTIASDAGLTLVDAWLEFDNVRQDGEFIWDSIILINENKGTLTVDSTYGSGVALTGEKYWEFVGKNTGEIILNDGDYSVYGDVVLNNGIENEDKTVIPGSLEINGGKFECGYSVVQFNYGDVTFTDSNVSSDYGIIGSKAGSISAKDSNFKAHAAKNSAFDISGSSKLELTNCVVEAWTCVKLNEDAEAVINGGTFIADQYVFEFISVYARGSYSYASTVTLSGETLLKGSPAFYVINRDYSGITVADGYEATPDETKWSTASTVVIKPVENVPGGNVAAIGDTEYATLAAAFEAAAADGDTITLLRNVAWPDDADPLNISGKSVTLDFDGHKISGGGVTWIDTIDSDAELTLVNAWLEFYNWSVPSSGSFPGLSTIYFINENKGTLTVDSTYGNGIALTGDRTYWEMVYTNTGTVTLNDGDYNVSGDVIRYNWNGDEETPVTGSLEINGGKIECGYSVVRENGGDVTIEDSKVTSDYDIVNNNYGDVTITDSEATADNCIIDESYAGSTVTAENCTFKAGGYAIDDIHGTLKLTDCTVEAGEDCVYATDGAVVTINGGTFKAKGCCVYAYDNTVTINGSTFTSSGDDHCIELYRFDTDCVITINGGAFKATGDGCNALYLSGGAAAVLGGEILFEGSPAIGAENNDFSGITVADGYWARPGKDEWQTASRVEILPEQIEVKFYSEDSLYHTYTGRYDAVAFPSNPVNSEGTDFLYWKDAEENVVTDPATVQTDTELYAVFSKKIVAVTFHDISGNHVENVINGTPLGSVPGMDRTENGDGFRGWRLNGETVNESTTTPLYADTDIYAAYNNVVFTYQELVDAVAAEEKNIIIGADIVVEDEVDVTYRCTISGLYGGEIHSLIRAKDFTSGDMLYFEALGTDDLKLENLIIDGNNVPANGSGLRFYLSSVTALENVTVRNNHGCGINVGLGTTLNLTDCDICCNTGSGNGGAALYISGYGTVRLFGSTSIHHNTADYSPAVWGNSGRPSLYMYDDSELAYNTATDGDGGAVYLKNLELIMNDRSSIHHNSAQNGNGGAVSNESSETARFQMNDKASIHDNYAGRNGGGLYMPIADFGSVKVNAEMIYDNAAGSNGDDVYALYSINIFREQPSRPFGDGNSAELDTVTVEQIPGYHEVTVEDGIVVPWLGWFFDGKRLSVTGPRYTFENRISFCHRPDEMLGGSQNRLNFAGLKAIWFGTVLAYDSNYEGGGYQFDNPAYKITERATVKDLMFEAPEGMMFVGWNTKPDGTGISYAPDDQILMNHSRVLYAQYEPIPMFHVVHHIIEGNTPDVIDDIPLSALGDDGLFDITGTIEGYYNGVRPGNIYGGMYVGDHESAEYDVTEAEDNLCGLELEPEDGIYYYLREVPDYYLAARALFVYDNGGKGEVKHYWTDSYLITVLDADGVSKEFYTGYGFAMNNSLNDRLKGTAATVGDDGTKIEDGSYYLYPTITVVYEDKPNSVYQVKRVFPLTTGYFGCVAIDHDRCEEDYEFTPYYITADYVLVTGVEHHKVEALDDSKQSPDVLYEEVAWTATKWVEQPVLLAMPRMLVSAFSFGVNPAAAPEKKVEMSCELLDGKDSYEVNEPITALVKTADTVEKVYFVSETGMGLCSDRTKTDNGDGTATWTLTLSLGTVGSRVLSVYADGEDTGLDAKFNVVYPTAAAEPEVISVTKPDSAKANEAFTVTITTNAYAKNVRLFNESGAGLMPSAYSYVEENGTRVWSYTIAVGTAGQRTFVAKAAAEDNVYVGSSIVSLYVA